MLGSEQQVSGARSTKDRVLEVAGELFYTRGIRAVGVDEIIDKAGIAKATLYRHFPGKEDIIVAYLEARKARLQRAFAESAARGKAAGAAGVLRIFDDLSRSVKASGFRGCGFLMAVAELDGSARVRATARAYKIFLRDGLRALLAAHTPNAAKLAEQLMLLYEGTIATAVLRPESAPALQARRCAEILLSYDARETVVRRTAGKVQRKTKRKREKSPWSAKI